MIINQIIIAQFAKWLVGGPNDVLCIRVVAIKAGKK